MSKMKDRANLKVALVCESKLLYADIAVRIRDSDLALCSSMVAAELYRSGRGRETRRYRLQNNGRKLPGETNAETRQRETEEGMKEFA